MTAKPVLLLATKNVKKVREMREILVDVAQVEIRSAADYPEVPEPQETGESFIENASQKALYYSRHTGLPALADDSGLVVDALDGRPGVYSSRYGSSDQDRIARLLQELGNVEDGGRKARFVCAMVFADGTQVRAQSEGVLEGFISREQRGKNGFGYDPVFYVKELGCHLAEAEPDVKNRVSHRGQALRDILPAVLGALRP